MLLDIGYQNTVPAQRVIGILDNSSAPMKRQIKAASDAGNMTDATQGRKTRSVVIMDNGRIFLSAIRPQSLVPRLHNALSPFTAHLIEGTTLEARNFCCGHNHDCGEKGDDVAGDGDGDDKLDLETELEEAEAEDAVAAEVPEAPVNPYTPADYQPPYGG